MLTDLKQFFLATLAYRFLSLGSICSLFKLAWHLNCSFLASACVEYFLGLFQTSATSEEDFMGQDSVYDRFNELERFFDSFVVEINSSDNERNSEGFSSCEYFRRSQIGFD